MIKTMIYAEISKEAAYKKGVEIGLSGEALEMFKHFNEVMFEIEVQDDGIVSKVTAVDL